MATLTVNKIARAGLVFGIGLVGTLAMANAAASDEFSNNGRTFVLVANDDAADPHSIVFTTQKSVLGLNLAELIVSVPKLMVDNEDCVIIGPFPTNIFNDSGGKVQVTYKEATDGTGVDASSDFAILVLSL